MRDDLNFYISSKEYRDQITLFDTNDREAAKQGMNQKALNLKTIQYSEPKNSVEESNKTETHGRCWCRTKEVGLTGRRGTGRSRVWTDATYGKRG